MGLGLYPSQGREAQGGEAGNVGRMNAEEFVAGDWIGRLAEALARLAGAQERHVLGYPGFRLRAYYASGKGSGRPPAVSVDELRDLYARARGSEATGDDEKFRSLRMALDEIRSVLRKHPAWAGMVDPDDRSGEIWVQIEARGELGTLWNVVDGLMARALELPENGFRVAASELNALLSPDEEAELPDVGCDLTVGYHAAIFRGVRVDGEKPVTDDMKIVPFVFLSDYLGDSALRSVAPQELGDRRGKSVGAIVKPFRWKPSFRARGEDTGPQRDSIGGFFNEAYAFIECLAVWHGAPVVCLATVPHCIHRTAYRLLGEAQHNGGYTLGRMAGSLHRFARSGRTGIDALDEARKAFVRRKGDPGGEFEPVISRLAEAMARSGQFAMDDKILDVAIALERMYEVERGGGSLQLKTRAACFLEREEEARWEVFEDIGRLFDARSGIIHRRQAPVAATVKQEAFSRGFEQARRTLAKLLDAGRPQDWNELLVGEAKFTGRTASGGAGTTMPGYRNRNDQVVTRRTNLPGNDHNQRVYVLRCARCRSQYGANGSDIWQRKCPNCGGGQPGLRYS